MHGISLGSGNRIDFTGVPRLVGMGKKRDQVSVAWRSRKEEETMGRGDWIWKTFAGFFVNLVQWKLPTIYEGGPTEDFL